MDAGPAEERGYLLHGQAEKKPHRQLTIRGVLLPCSGVADTLAGAEEPQCSRHGAVKGEKAGTVW